MAISFNTAKLLKKPGAYLTQMRQKLFMGIHPLHIFISEADERCGSAIEWISEGKYASRDTKSKLAFKTFSGPTPFYRRWTQLTET